MLPDALRKTPGLSRQRTERQNKDGVEEPELKEYAQTFIRVVKGTFGNDKAVTATIFTEGGGNTLPVRMLTIQLDSPDLGSVHVQRMEADKLLDTLAAFHGDQLSGKIRNSKSGGLGFQRVAYLLHPSHEDGCRTMNLTVIKPDERRYWTRSMAMRDADHLGIAMTQAAQE